MADKIDEVEEHEAFRYVLRQDDRVISGLAHKKMVEFFVAACSAKPKTPDDLFAVMGNIRRSLETITEQQIASPSFRLSMPDYNPQEPFQLSTTVCNDRTQPRYLVQQGLITIEYNGNKASFPSPNMPKMGYGLLEIDTQAKVIRQRQGEYTRLHLVGVIGAGDGTPLLSLGYEIDDVWKLYDRRGRQASSGVWHQRLHRIHLEDDLRDYRSERERLVTTAIAAGAKPGEEDNHPLIKGLDMVINRIQYKLRH